MSTMRQELIQAIMGTPSLDKCPSNWSPNMLKALIITREYVIVVNHGKFPKLVQFNPADAYEFIIANGSKGKLQNVLTARTLSCLEEIYVDSVFMQYSGALDLQAFVNQIQSGVSRLRFYGFIQDYDKYNNIMECYYNAASQGKKDYTYAQDKNRTTQVSITSTDNSEWFKKYNLRPQEYPSIDKEGGNLHAWFKSVENAVSRQYEADKAALEGNAKLKAYQVLLMQDVQIAKSFNYLRKASSAVKQRMLPHTTIAMGLANCYSNSNVKPLVRISKEDLGKVLPTLGVTKDEARPLHLFITASKALIDDDKSLVKLEDINEKLSKGANTLLDWGKAIRLLISDMNKAGAFKGNTLLLITEAKSGDYGVELQNCSSKEDIINTLNDLSKLPEDITWAVNYLLAICGFSIEALEEVA